MLVEIKESLTQKGTCLINGNDAENKVLEYIAGNYSLQNYNVHLHLVEPRIPNARGDASYSSLRKKMQSFRKIGVQTKVFVHPYAIHNDDLRESIADGSENQNTVGIIIQMPIPEHLQAIPTLIDPTKDIDSLNPYNTHWPRCATADATLRLLLLYHDLHQKIGLVGANGFIGRHINRGVVEHDIGEVIPVEFNDLLELLKKCQTVISVAGQPNLIEAQSLHLSTNLGIDIGNTKSNQRITGDFNFPNVDGLVKYLTPVPGGMGPLEMIVLAERIVRNTIDSHFEVQLKRS